MIIKPHQLSEGKEIRSHSFPILDLEEPAVMEQIAGPEDVMAAQSQRIAALQEEIAATSQRSFDEGFKKGKQALYEEKMNALMRRVEELGEMVETLRRQEEEVVKSAEGFVLNFALKVAEKIIGSTEFSKAALDIPQLQKFISEALNQFSDSSKFILRVNKNTVESLEKALPQIQQKLTRPAALAITADPSLKPGDCLIECDHGVLDARIDSRLKEIKRVFSDNK